MNVPGKTMFNRFNVGRVLLSSSLLLAGCSSAPAGTVDAATDTAGETGDGDVPELDDTADVGEQFDDTSSIDADSDADADDTAGDTATDIDLPDAPIDSTDGPDADDGSEADIADAVPDSEPADSDAEADTDASSDAEADVTDGDSSDAAEPDTDPSCSEGVVCGPAGDCCRAGSECLADACVELCPSRIRCGDDRLTCCETGSVCLAGACTEPVGDCIDSFDCPDDYFCEPTLAACLPQPESLECEVLPEFDDVNVTVEWSFTGGEIISIPVVGDINGDGIPDVVVNLANRDGGGWERGEIAAFRGSDGTERWRILHDPAENRYGSHGRSTIGLGDVDGDGLPDVVYASREVSGGSRVVAVDGDGELIWLSTDGTGAAAAFDVENGAPSLANFDDDAEAEIVFGATLLDNDGRVVWNDGGQGARLGTNDGYIGGISAIADLDGDGYPEIVSGRNAWKVTRVGSALEGASVAPYWTAAGADGYPAVADIDLNGSPEVILVASRSVRILEGTSGRLWCGVDPTGAACTANETLRTQPILIPGGATANRGGPPTVSDFDGDGRPEIGVAGGYSYTVYDINRDGEEVVQPSGAVPPQPGQIYERWSQTTRDRSSNSTGSSVFDFQGDGAAEVVYADECYMRVYDGATGRIQLEIESSSATIHEYPLVVDVDGDNNSEIVIVANSTGATTNCAISGYRPRMGLFVYGDAGDGWLRTRRVWTQHAYHVTNATSDGNVPFAETSAWTIPGLNAYRQNIQTEGAFNAPDLSVVLDVDRGYCPLLDLGLVATITNNGTLGVPAGLAVSFYDRFRSPAVLLGVERTAAALLPGESTTVVYVTDLPPLGERDFEARVDDNGAGDGVFFECNEDNNSSGYLMADCYGY